jgi:hypothetical protein
MAPRLAAKPMGVRPRSSNFSWPGPSGCASPTLDENTTDMPREAAMALGGPHGPGSAAPVTC